MIPNRFIASFEAASAFNQKLKENYQVNDKIEEKISKDISQVVMYKVEPRLCFFVQLKF